MTMAAKDLYKYTVYSVLNELVGAWTSDNITSSFKVIIYCLRTDALQL